jgi:hypothetical protein
LPRENSQLVFIRKRSEDIDNIEPCRLIGLPSLPKPGSRWKPTTHRGRAAIPLTKSVILHPLPVRQIRRCLSEGLIALPFSLYFSPPGPVFQKQKPLDVPPQHNRATTPESCRRNPNRYFVAPH